MKIHGKQSSFLALDSFQFEESVGSKTEDLYKKLPCLICNASASGIHFGAVTCEACKVRKQQTNEGVELEQRKRTILIKSIVQGFFPSFSKRKCSATISL